MKSICRRCGKCCIVCTDINLTNEEVASRRYKMQPHTKRIKSGAIKLGYSDQVLKQKRKFIPKLGYKEKVCIYFDPEKVECLIYNDRPKVCRRFDCSDLLYAQPILKEWERMEAARAD